MAPNVRMNLEWQVPVAQIRSISGALQQMAEGARGAPACVSCVVETNVTKGSIRYSEEWRFDDDLRQRVQSDDFMRLLGLVEQAIVQPKVQFILAHDVRGLDFVAEARQALD